MNPSTQKTPNILTAKNITKDFGHTKKSISVLRGIDAQFKQNTSYAITGASGSGKSTLMHILGGLDKPTQGNILFNGQNIQTIKKDHFLNQTIGFVFQFHYLIKELTVLENIMLMGLINGQARNICKQRAHELLEKTGIQDKAQALTTELSGGQQQRVSIARALFNKPAFLLADEPTGNLDAQNAQQIVQLFLQSQQEWGMGIIICTHDKDVYAHMNTIFTLHAGLLTQTTTDTQK